MKTRTNDPIVDEVRSAREKHAAKFGYDINKIFQDIKERQKNSGRKYVRYPAKPAESETETT